MIPSSLSGSVAVVLVAVSLGACGSGNVPLGTQSSANTSGSQCQAAGGTCLSIGDDPCGTRAPSSEDDCNAQLLPSGPFCCLAAPKDAGANDAATSVCQPLPCPSGAPWDQAACACVAPGSADAAADACLPLPCPAGAPWDQGTCSCGTGGTGVADAACAPLPCPTNEHWDPVACTCAT